jgi:Tol biopolymer transport system component
VYMRDNRTLAAQHFDLTTFKLSGEAKVLEDDVLYYPGVDRAVFGLSSDVLVAQKRAGANVSQLTWFDRSGKKLSTISNPGSYSNVRLSPDVRKLAADQSDAEGRNIDIWIHDLDRDSKTRLTFGPGLVQMPSWSPDGSKVLYAGNHKLGWEIYQKNADGSGSEQRVGNFGAMNEVSVWDWSHNGKFVLARKGDELWYLTYPQGDPKPLLEGKTVENAQFSPDDRWTAYACNESGRMEVYVSPFPSFDTKWQISSGGGREPKWRRDGKELFYISAEGKIMAVVLGKGPTFEAGSPVVLFQTRLRQPVSAQDRFSYDVSSNGQKFLIITKSEVDNAAPLSVLLDWQSSLQE